jgi:hypothetical protein
MKESGPNVLQLEPLLGSWITFLFGSANPLIVLSIGGKHLGLPKSMVWKAEKRQCK